MYKNGPRVKYPSSLHVTVKSILSPKSFTPGVGSVYAFEKDELLRNLEMNSQDPYENTKKLNEDGELLKDGPKSDIDDLQDPAGSKKKTIIWSRIAGLPCRIPNDLDLKLNTSKRGCYSIKFSTSGSYLACACVEDESSYPIYVYEIPNGRLHAKFYGHFGLIYEINWSKLDKYFITASHDATARFGKTFFLFKNIKTSLKFIFV